MIVGLLALAGIVVGAWALRRWLKRRLVAGLVESRPMFMVAPPTRRVGSRKDEAL